MYLQLLLTIRSGSNNYKLLLAITNWCVLCDCVRSPQGGRLSNQLPPWNPLKPGEPLTFYRLSLTPGMVIQPFRNKVSAPVSELLTYL